MAKHTKKKCRTVRGKRVCKQTRRAQKSRKGMRRSIKSKRGGKLWQSSALFGKEGPSERRAYMNNLMKTIFKGKTLSQSMKKSMAHWVKTGY